MGRPEHRAFYFHYAWVIVAIIAAMQMVGTTMRMAFGVLVDPLTETFGWSQGEVTLAYGITSVVTALASPWAGSLGDRYGARICMIAGTAMFVVGMAATALVTEPWHFYVSFGVILGVAQAIFLVPLIPAAMNWFHRRLGLAMGVIMAAWGVGPALAAPVVGLLVGEYGWADSVWIITAVSSVSMFALIALFRDWPSDKGVPPYGESSDVAAERPAKRIDKVQVKLFTRLHAPDQGLLEHGFDPLPGLRRPRHHPRVPRPAGHAGGHVAGVRRRTADGPVRGQRDNPHDHADDVRAIRREAGHGVLVRHAGASRC